LSGATVGAVSPSSRIVLPIAFAAITIGAVYICIRVRPLRWLDPLIWMLLPLAVEFVARPLAVLASGQFTYKNYFVLPYYTEVSAIGLVGLIALCGGYAARLPVTLGRMVPSVPDVCDEDRAGTLSYQLIGVGLVAYAVFAAQSGLSPSALLTNGLRGNVNGGSTAYLAFAPFLAVPACLLLLRRGLNTSNSRLIAAVAALALFFAFIFGSAGSRFAALYYGSLVMYLMLRYRFRPPRWLVAVGLCVVLLFVASKGNLNSGGATVSLGTAIGQAASHPVKTMESIVLGGTDEMFDGMAVEVQFVPAQLGFHPFTSVTSVLAEPVPRILWPGKPYYPEGNLDNAAFGYLGVGKGAASVAFTIMGGLYYDSGIIGVIVGMVLVGALLRVISEYVTKHRGNEFVQLTFAAILPLVILLSRGNFGDTLSRSLFLVVPIPVIAYLARKPAHLGERRRSQALTPRSG
jgi:hypothetical protein